MIIRTQSSQHLIRPMTMIEVAIYRPRAENATEQRLSEILGRIVLFTMSTPTLAYEQRTFQSARRRLIRSNGDAVRVLPELF
jgi:hypothetical protein